MNKTYLIILLSIVVNCTDIFSQNEITSSTPNDSNNTEYKFELSLEPQDGYSLILNLNGAPKEGVSFTNFEMGIARTFIYDGHETTTIDRTLTLGVINHNSNLFYSLGFGYNFRSILDLGLFLNYNNNFINSNAFTLRPQIGFIILPPIGSAYAEFAYNINFLKNNFDISNYFVVGFRYNIGFLKSKIDKNNSN
jgi:hypothetical protein